MKVSETVNARKQKEDFIGEKMRQLEKLKEEIEREQRKYSEQRFSGSGKEDWATHKEDGVSAVSHNSVGRLQRQGAWGCPVNVLGDLFDIKRGQVQYSVSSGG